MLVRPARPLLADRSATSGALPNELSVFEGAIAQNVPAGGKPAVTDENWLSVYRGVFSRYSFLRDEVYGEWMSRIDSSKVSRDKARTLRYGVIQILRIAIKCIVRIPSGVIARPMQRASPTSMPSRRT